jgi:hypothetical protein
MTNKVYDRQVGESDKAFEAFTVYRDMGANRSHDAVAQKLSKSSTIISRWASQHGWRERVSAYDDYMDAQARKKFEADAIKRKVDMLKRHALTGKILQQKGVDYLSSKGVDRSSDAVAAIKAGVTIERQSEGLPEYMMEIVNADDNEIARQYAALLASLGNEPDADSPSETPDPVV